MSVGHNADLTQRFRLALSALEGQGWGKGCVEDSVVSIYQDGAVNFGFSTAIIQDENGGQFLSLVCTYIFQQPLKSQTISLIDRLAGCQDVRQRPIGWSKTDDGIECLTIEMRLVFDDVRICTALEMTDVITKGQGQLSEIAMPIVEFNDFA